MVFNQVFLALVNIGFISNARYRQPHMSIPTYVQAGGRLIMLNIRGRA